MNLLVNEPTRRPGQPLCHGPLIMAAWWSAKPWARSQVSSSTSRAPPNDPRPVWLNTLHAAITSAAAVEGVQMTRVASGVFGCPSRV